MRVRLDYVFDGADVVRFEVSAHVDSDDECVARGASRDDVPEAISRALADAVAHARHDVVPQLTALLKACRASPRPGTAS